MTDGMERGGWEERGAREGMGGGVTEGDGCGWEVWEDAREAEDEEAV